MLRPAVIEKFGGLNLADDPSEFGAGGAVDLRNVWFDRGGLRAGPNDVDFATAERDVVRIFPHSSGLQLLASENDGANVTLQAFDGVGSSIASTTYASINIQPHAFASIGTPSASRTYAVRNGDTSRVWNGSAWATVAGVPSGACAAPADNGTRLAIGYAGGNRNRVAFSDAGDPETFGADNYVDVAPGDGETICDLVFWEGKLFAFKNTKFAVFYGTGIDLTGEPVFNYRMVDVGIGIGVKGLDYSGGACAGPDGVYFIGPGGIYRTRGDEPQLISREISPLWPNSTPARADTSVPRVSLSAGLDISVVNDDVYVCIQTVDTSAAHATFVLHDGRWTYLTLRESGIGAYGYGNFVGIRGSVYFVTPKSPTIKELNFSGASSRSWQYTSGFYDFGSPAEKKLRYTDVYGTGSVSLQLLTRGGRVADLVPGDISLTLGVSPTVARARRSQSARGRQFALKLTGVGPFTVNRLDHLYLPPGSAA